MTSSVKREPTAAVVRGLNSMIDGCGDCLHIRVTQDVEDEVAAVKWLVEVTKDHALALSAAKVYLKAAALALKDRKEKKR